MWAKYRCYLSLKAEPACPFSRFGSSSSGPQEDLLQALLSADELVCGDFGEEVALLSPDVLAEAVEDRVADQRDHDLLVE